MTKIVVISPNASLTMGGEAIKAHQFFQFLLETGYDAILCCHARCRSDIEGHFPVGRVLFIEDDAIFKSFWRIRPLRSLVNPYFHLQAKQKLLAAGLDNALWHFLCPISPVEPRFFAKGTTVVIGPLNGNLFFPPAFLSRLPAFARIQQHLYRPIQSIVGRLIGDKRRANVVLNSGGDRTEAALRWAGVPPDLIADVTDSGLTEGFAARAPVSHSGENLRFLSVGRLIDLKANDLAIEAVAKAQKPVTLDIFGEGPDGPRLKALVSRLGLENRVHLRGWISHDDLIARANLYRGFIFPSLAEANGIVVQEMMSMGVPVVCLDWGGPARLVDARSAVLIPPTSSGVVVAGLANAMDRLSWDADHAEALSKSAHTIATSRFPWPVVAASWIERYPAPLEIRSRGVSPAWRPE
ncbi:glycosyltransferase [Salipiger sp. IMCC34102]|uniref:glycosyltransferase family 4 protein n=1 Tax=Salipiger sp. IMCC34102 TaxID=2510647 RepID=UPI00101B7A62|nr:glycosyltransferase family 4 protein [Salipiger sp. IMCC34102]RYH04348.1 glycosyltransferase [Salipiger sp. IMCC34102]